MMSTQSPVHALLRIVGICATVILLAAQIANAQSGDWERGKLIGLRAGTCIREGPGLNYRAHTQVPEDNWTVMVIDGPRTTGSEVWYDTSRKAAGDPSGGTGWVMADWSDRDCSSPVTAPPPQPQPAPSIPTPSGPDSLLDQFRAWWSIQSPMMKWIVALVALALLVMIWRRVGSHLISLVFAIIGALLLVWLMDGIRGVWQGPWHDLVGADAPDLALLVAAIPLISWLLGLVRRSQTS